MPSKVEQTLSSKPVGRQCGVCCFSCTTALSAYIERSLQSLQVETADAHLSYSRYLLVRGNGRRPGPTATIRLDLTRALLPPKRLHMYTNEPLNPHSRYTPLSVPGLQYRYGGPNHRAKRIFKHHTWISHEPTNQRSILLNDSDLLYARQKTQHAMFRTTNQLVLSVSFIPIAASSFARYRNTYGMATFTIFPGPCVPFFTPPETGLHVIHRTAT